MVEDIMHLPIFQGIEQPVLEDIINTCEVREYEAMTDIITEGETSNGEGYIIKSGRVAIMIGEKKVKTLSRGEIFGEIALLNEEERTATVKTLDDVEVLVLKLENIIEMINSGNNSISKQVVERIEENLKM